MEQEMTYIEAETCTDQEKLFEYCVEGIIDAAENHNGSIDAWEDGRHVVNAYLEHNTVIDDGTRRSIADEVQLWLRANTRSAVPVPARRYESDDRAILIRKELPPSERYYWCHPQDGSPHGAGVDAYVRFVRREDAIRWAKDYGYEVVSE